MIACEPVTGHRLVDLRQGQCRYCITSHHEPVSRYRFCGKPIASERAWWCAEHRAVVLSAVQPHDAEAA